MDYQGTIIRPPSEANSIILQITVGCSHNKCTFCGTYKGVRFGIKTESVIQQDIEFAARYCGRQRRVFLTDGDALIIPKGRLLRLLKTIRERLPWVTRVGTYGNAKSIRTKTLDDLIALRQNGLGIVYMGLESGDDVTLKKSRKGVSVDTIIKMGQRVREAGIKLSVTVLLGLAGPERSAVHAEATGRALSAMDPDHVGALSLMLLPNTPLWRDHAEGHFKLVSPMAMLRELKTMIAHTDLSRGLFYANHASNYLPIKARLPRDKEATIDLIDQAIVGNIPLMPEFMRAL
ncbi:MAG: radical SAM protein [Desulfobacterales bacterium C00003060]|nr:MAG: radical SAM protein [Desulfobacterales bacterium S3730MH5]OEU79128.1 MAG: radical SAM protein [Desulfobacterales bacterium C00003060]OEU84657.1 MAG: radical SAM protein [Desulfobacterales bacterium S5133MH4]